MSTDEFDYEYEFGYEYEFHYAEYTFLETFRFD